MPRTTKAVTAKAKHKKFFPLQKATMVREVGYIKLQNSQILNRFNTLLEIEKTRREPLDLCGLLEYQLH